MASLHLSVHFSQVSLEKVDFLHSGEAEIRDFGELVLGCLQLFFIVWGILIILILLRLLEYIAVFLLMLDLCLLWRNQFLGFPWNGENFIEGCMVLDQLDCLHHAKLSQGKRVVVFIFSFNICLFRSIAPFIAHFVHTREYFNDGSDLIQISTQSKEFFNFSITFSLVHHIVVAFLIESAYKGVDKEKFFKELSHRRPCELL
jgi:hypothetical protein